MGILQEIVEYKKSSLNKSYSYFDELLGRIKENNKVLSLKEFVISSKPIKTPIIAEIKQASPSMGHIKNVDIRKQAKLYQEAGACGISVLTDEKFFKGELKFLELVRSVVNIPVMRKDFVIDPIQVYETKAFGADAILLIARILDIYQIEDITYEAKKLSLDILMEIFEETEIEKISKFDFELVGVNNRDLDTLDIDISKSKKLLPLLRKNTKSLLISESGISSKEDIDYLEGFDGFLIGTSIMKEENPYEKLKELIW